MSKAQIIAIFGALGIGGYLLYRYFTTPRGEAVHFVGAGGTFVVPPSAETWENRGIDLGLPPEQAAAVAESYDEWERGAKEMMAGRGY